ncbi:hypothetical protein LIER_08133 [Lithospermum erythrorhizon]|uniref:Uncharacterized protein n=1 Tax=Lithospermum erythrorhizon TaxID=34254 RepID=A0AAV3PDM0_LITER
MAESRNNSPSGRSRPSQVFKETLREIRVARRVAEASHPEPSKGKYSKYPPTLESVKAKTVPGLITDYQLRQIRNYYDIPDKVKTQIPLEGESFDTPSYEVLMTLDRAPGQLMHFSLLVLTVFHVAYLVVGVHPNMALFGTMYNVIHKGPLCYFQVASSSYNFLCTKKIDKVEPSRWFKLGFLAKGGFSDDVCAHWSFSNSTVASEDSARTQAEVDKLRVGFPRALPHEVFCDRDVLIKAGLAKGVGKFPNVTLLELLLQRDASGSCTMPHKVNFKLITSGKDPLAQISKRKGNSARDSSSEVHVIESPQTETALFFKRLSDRGHRFPEGYSNNLSFVKELYVEEKHGGGFAVFYPEDLHDSFSHFQLKDTECAYGLSLKWRESEESRARLEPDRTSLEKWLAEVLRERDEVGACARDLEGKYEDLQAVCNGLVKSKFDLSHQYEVYVAALKNSLEKSEQRSRDLKTQLDSSRHLLAGSEKQLEQSRPPPETFSLKVYEEFPDILSMFPEFMGKHFGKAYVVPLTSREVMMMLKAMMALGKTMRIPGLF